MLKIEVKPIAEKIREGIKKEVAGLKVKPRLATILVGNDKASLKYVTNKVNLCMEVGIDFSIHRFDEDVDTIELVALIKELNADDRVNGILVQLPLPDHIDVPYVINTIYPKKDVDGLTNTNQGMLYNSQPCIVPCTPLGIMFLLDDAEIDLTGKNVVVIGRSALLGKPLASLLGNRNATVTTCNSYTEDLVDYTIGADVIICCTGKHGILNPYMCSNGAVVIDAGTTFVNGKLVGDFDTDLLESELKLTKTPDIRYTPVPGGVGLMTTTMLMFNTLKCYKMQR